MSALQDIFIDVVNRDPADSPSGIPLKLAMESCHAGFDVDDLASVFEEHFTCRSLAAWYCASSQTDGCTVYVEDERKFMFINVLIGSRVSARFKLRNSSKVLVFVFFCCCYWLGGILYSVWYIVGGGVAYW